MITINNRGKIAESVPELSAKAQFHPSTTKTSDSVPGLCKAAQFRPCAHAVLTPLAVCPVFHACEQRKSRGPFTLPRLCRSRRRASVSLPSPISLALRTLSPTIPHTGALPLPSSAPAVAFLPRSTLTASLPSSTPAAFLPPVVHRGGAELPARPFSLSAGPSLSDPLDSTARASCDGSSSPAPLRRSVAEELQAERGRGGGGLGGCGGEGRSALLHAPLLCLLLAPGPPPRSVQRPTRRR
jgi:hypothetical protein